MLKRFLNDEGGAVTVDWTVMTAAVAGLGLATYGVVSGGIGDLSGDVSAQLSGQSISSRFGGAFSPMTLVDTTFTGGDRGDWVGGRLLDMGGTLGELLALGQNETAELPITFPDGTSTGRISFDLIGGDSGDGELVTISADGTPVLLGTYNVRRVTGEMIFNMPDVPGVTVTTEMISENRNLGGGGWTDAVTRVSIALDDPPSNLILAARSGTNQPVSDEYFGIDNVTVTAE